MDRELCTFEFGHLESACVIIFISVAFCPGQMLYPPNSKRHHFQDFVVKLCLASPDKTASIQKAIRPELVRIGLSFTRNPYRIYTRSKHNSQILSSVSDHKLAANWGEGVHPLSINKKIFLP